MFTLEVFGAGDDNIEIRSGTIREEFLAYDTTDGALVAFSNGTVLRVTFTQTGVWRITTVVAGDGELSIVQAPEDDEDNYSDVATLSGLEIKWVVCGNQIALPEKKKTKVGG